MIICELAKSDLIYYIWNAYFRKVKSNFFWGFKTFTERIAWLNCIVAVFPSQKLFIYQLCLLVFSQPSGVGAAMTPWGKDEFRWHYIYCVDFIITHYLLLSNIFQWNNSLKNFRIGALDQKFFWTILEILHVYIASLNLQRDEQSHSLGGPKSSAGIFSVLNLFAVETPMMFITI